VRAAAAAAARALAASLAQIRSTFPTTEITGLLRIGEANLRLAPDSEVTGGGKVGKPNGG